MQLPPHCLSCTPDTLDFVLSCVDDEVPKLREQRLGRHTWPSCSMETMPLPPSYRVLRQLNRMCMISLMMGCHWLSSASLSGYSSSESPPPSLAFHVCCLGYSCYPMLLYLHCPTTTYHHLMVVYFTHNCQGEYILYPIFQLHFHHTTPHPNIIPLFTSFNFTNSRKKNCFCCSIIYICLFLKSFYGNFFTIHGGNNIINECLYCDVETCPQEVHQCKSNYFAQ